MYEIMGYSILAIGIGMAIIFGAFLAVNKWGNIGLSSGARKVFSILVLIGFVLTGVGAIAFIQEPVDVIPPTTHQTSYELNLGEVACYDFTWTANDGDCATGATEIEVDIASREFTITPTWVMGTTGGGTGSTPDSIGMQFTAKRTDDGWYEPGTSDVLETGLRAKVLDADEWKIENANGTQEVVRIVERDTEGTPSIAWTDVGGNSFVTSDIGNVNLYDAGESGQFELTIYLNEDFTNVPTKESYTFTGTVILEDDYGTSMTVTIIVIITVT